MGLLWMGAEMGSVEQRDHDEASSVGASAVAYLPVAGSRETGTRPVPSNPQLPCPSLQGDAGGSLLTGSYN